MKKKVNKMPMKQAWSRMCKLYDQGQRHSKHYEVLVARVNSLAKEMNK